jgi:hypothetical protein
MTSTILFKLGAALELTLVTTEYLLQQLTTSHAYLEIGATPNCSTSASIIKTFEEIISISITFPSTRIDTRKFSHTSQVHWFHSGRV